MADKKTAEQIAREKTEKAEQRYFDTAAKALAKSLSRLHEKMGFCNGTIESLLRFSQNDPAVFALSQYPENRNFLKFILQENIELYQKFYDRIVDLEKEYDLPTENIGDPE